MRKNLIVATLIAAGILLWLLSGLFGSNDGDRAANPPPLAEAQPRETSREPVAVRARESRAEPRQRTLALRGRTDNKRTVEVRAEITGMVIERPVERGSRVEAGDLLCRVAVDDREVAVAEAEAALKRARIEYEGALKLREMGLQSATAIAQAEAGLAAARATLKREQLNLERTALRAPFAGVVEAVALEIGDYATPGTTCATLLDLDPMLVTARVSAGDAARLEVGAPVRAVTATGRELTATLSFIGNQSDTATRTYALEATLPNPDYLLRSGVPATLEIPTGEVQAHRVSPALFTLDDAGRLGLRTLDRDNRVVFQPIDIIEDGAEGTWVTGLPSVTRIITVGQEFVFDGQRVRVEQDEPMALSARSAR
ncbi:efflux RND transporter periplasmic adaptor subunit [Pseudohaliea rubra]|uniref:Putative RND efflux membrane fusion protein n=1 Tax=Pseudohaliea rubra DSM 19751 TaxID=1265313 RepID=A0A095WZX0_9GAMM|nr:efflux RND transporter periplasmic adaptor subunit [Pseudohaliea rubra]KGE04164.1 putative RND efflux membrane fusion protein [Pseudohaliea rubra DSM 19751]